ncbi:MAG TPA: DUF1697 domain-containing protein [Steroidobacteraceae bacterium]|nr:DUF1697 domain-containing protein [Steroidobacteraceae bacterium]
MSTCIALIRGINVGVGKRVAMADLRDLVADLGHTDVRTLLNSGNVVFTSKRPNAMKISSGIEAAITASCGFSANVMVITAQELDCIIDENPLLHLAKEPSKHLVAFVGHAGHLEPMRPMLKEPWKPDALAITQRAAYLWCATGLLDSKLSLAFSRKAGATVTTRNWATVLKLQAAAKDATEA